MLVAPHHTHVSMLYYLSSPWPLPLPKEEGVPLHNYLSAPTPLACERWTWGEAHNNKREKKNKKQKLKSYGRQEVLIWRLRLLATPVFAPTNPHRCSSASLVCICRRIYPLSLSLLSVGEILRYYRCTASAPSVTVRSVQPSKKERLTGMRILFCYIQYLAFISLKIKINLNSRLSI